MSTESNWEASIEIAAVNDILAAVGEAPVTTLDGEANIDVVNAQRLLHKNNREVQAIGWSFNIDELSLMPDMFGGYIPYLPEYLLITTAGGTRLTNRGGYVFDRDTKSDVFSGPLEVTAVVLRPFEEMPPCFQTYIVAKSARQFNSRFFGAPELAAELEAEEGDAYRFVNEYELDYLEPNMFQGDPFVSSAIGR